MNYLFRLSAHTILQGDFNIRSADRWEEINTILFRPGIIVPLHKGWSVGLGYGLVYSHETLDDVKKYVAENQVWEQVSLSLPVNFHHKRGNLYQRLRIENRFIPEIALDNNTIKTTAIHFSNRVRYLVRSVMPLARVSNFTRGFFVALQNEMLINITDRQYASGRILDETRSNAAAGYRFSNHVDTEFGYMFQYAEETGHVFGHNHILVLTTWWRF